LAVVDSATPGAQQVAAGAYYANLPAHLSNSTALRQKGAPLGVVVMGDVPTGLATCMGIAANAPHPNAARLFMTWSLTVASHQAGCSKFEAGSPLPAATKCIKLPQGWKPTNLAVMKDPARQRALVKALGL
jgi:ABC-type Fe3+ transport system substrate-binding protein